MCKSNCRGTCKIVSEQINCKAAATLAVNNLERLAACTTTASIEGTNKNNIMKEISNLKVETENLPGNKNEFVKASDKNVDNGFSEKIKTLREKIQLLQATLLNSEIIN